MSYSWQASQKVTLNSILPHKYNELAGITIFPFFYLNDGKLIRHIIDHILYIYIFVKMEMWRTITINTTLEFRIKHNLNSTKFVALFLQKIIQWRIKYMSLLSCQRNSQLLLWFDTCKNLEIKHKSLQSVYHNVLQK